MILERRTRRHVPLTLSIHLHHLQEVKMSSIHERTYLFFTRVFTGILQWDLSKLNRLNPRYSKAQQQYFYNRW